MSKRVPVTLPPGSGRRATPQDTRGAWWDMSLVRFVSGVLRPWGGWAKLPGVQTYGAVRNILSWRDNDRLRWVAAASLAQVVVWDGNAGTVLSPGDFAPGEAGGIPDGYGVGDYGMEAYGTHRSRESEQTRAVPSDSVTLDNWGENLLVMGSADGRLMQWAPVLPVNTVMTPVPNAPAGRTMIVTDQRHIMILGADGDPRRLSWCSQELPTDWVPTITNTAGSLQVRSSGAGLSMRRVSQGVLIWCDDDVHLASYVGPPYVYGVDRIGSGCGPAGPESMVAMTGRAVWIGAEGFWMYDGALRPLPCPIAEYVFSDIVPTLRGNTYGFHNGIYPEITFGYCSTNSPNPDKYVTWNYQDNLWTHGHINRSIGCEPGAFGLPLLGDSDGYIYQHETGWLDDGQPRGATVYAETGDLQIGDGDTGIFVSAIYPDLKQPQLVQFHLKGQWEAGGPEDDFGVFVQERTDGVIDVCHEVRSLRLRIEGLQDGEWQLGRIRLETAPGAGR